MDIQNVGFIGLMTLGAVNVVTFFKSNMDSRVKFALSVVFAFVLTFVPKEIGTVILDKAKQAIEIALFVSGGYKMAQVVKPEMGQPQL
jgi:hypothetical protein